MPKSHLYMRTAPSHRQHGYSAFSHSIQIPRSEKRLALNPPLLNSQHAHLTQSNELFAFRFSGLELSVCRVESMVLVLNETH